MLLISSTWNQKKSFKLIPISLDCPYVEAIFDPAQKILAIIGKEKKQTYHMLPALDKEGNIITKTRKVKEGETLYKQERRLVESWSEYYIESHNEIAEFIKMFAINSDSYYWGFAFTNNSPLQDKNPVELKATVTEPAEV